MPQDDGQAEALVFSVDADLESDVLVASWDDPGGGGITTQANTLRELSGAIREAVRCHFADSAI